MDVSKLRTALLAAYLLSAFGGAVYCLGWTGFGIWPLALIALVPLWLALELVGARSWKTALGIGLVYGTVATGGGYHWMLETSRLFSGLEAAANLGIFIACSTYLGLQYGLQAVLYRAVRLRNGSVATAAVPSLLVSEWLFPKWYPVFVGNALIHEPILVQAADIGGALMLSALVGLVNVIVFEAVRSKFRMRTSARYTVAVSVVVVGCFVLYGALRIRQVEAAVSRAPTLKVGLVQADMGISAKRQNPLESPRRHREQSREFEGDVDLVVWPETVHYPWLPRVLPFEANELHGELKTPILFGSFSFTRETGRQQVYNSVFLLRRDGWIHGLYDKNHLMVGGEYLPFAEAFPFLYRLSPNSGRLTPGSHIEPLLLDAWRISTPVCYEDILPGFIRDMVNHANPHLLVNLTNDAWFGDSQAPWIHLRLAQLRAVEHRRYLVRATNTGISAVVDPVGRVVAHTAVLTRENLTATVHMMEGDTLYARLGDWPGWLSLVITAAVLARRKRR